MTWLSASGNPYVHLFTGAQGTCAGENIGVEWDLAGAEGSQDAPINPGYVVPAGKALCAHMGGTASIGVNVYGYLFAAGTIPTPQLAIGTAHANRP